MNSKSGKILSIILRFDQSFGLTLPLFLCSEDVLKTFSSFSFAAMPIRDSFSRIYIFKKRIKSREYKNKP